MHEMPHHWPGCPGIAGHTCECSGMPQIVKEFTLGPVTLLPLRFELLVCEARPQDAVNPPRLHVEARVIDRETGKPREIVSSSRIPIHSLGWTVGVFASWVRSELARMLMHELDEVLLVEGRHFRDPHARSNLNLHPLKGVTDV